MTHTYLVSWYGTQQIEKPSIYPEVNSVEFSGRIGNTIMKQEHTVCEDDYYEWQEEIQAVNDLYKLPAIIAISEIRGVGD